MKPHITDEKAEKLLENVPAYDGMTEDEMKQAINQAAFNPAVYLENAFKYSGVSGNLRSKL